VHALPGDDPELGRALVAHPHVDAVSFTGSTAVGREVVANAAARGARVQAEMGGHAPLVVLEDADLDATVVAASVGAFASAGQKCTSTRRIYVAQGLYRRFVDALCERAASLEPGPADDEATTLGPLVDVAARDRVRDRLAQAAAAGTLEVGGDVPSRTDPALTAYLRPAVLTELPIDAPFALTETFGPAVAVWPLRPDDDFIACANRTDAGLAAAIYTNDLSAAQRFVREIRAGLVHVNSQTAGAEVHVPFGGHGNSGYGTREQGREAYAFFTKDRTVYVDAAPRAAARG
jgi:aldehyde dehydrogenase (NAD+)